MSAKNAHPDKLFLNIRETNAGKFIDWAEVDFNGGEEYTRSDLLPRWVSVEEGLPEKRGEYFIVYHWPFQVNLHTGKSEYNPKTGWDCESAETASQVTHFLSNVPPIPEGK